MPSTKESLRTQKVAFFWRWWDEAEHKSSPEKRLAFYDAMMRYVFRGDVPRDPHDMENPTGVDYAAYDATHYFDVIDSLVEHPHGGAPKGNQNARKKTTKNNLAKQPKTTTQNNAEGLNEDGETTDAEQPFIRMKNEERRMKNSTFAEANANSRAREAAKSAVPNVASETPPVAPPSEPPTLDDILRVCRNDDCANPGGAAIPAAFGRYFHETMQGMGWQQTNGRRVTRRNFRPFLFTWWKRADASEWAGDGGGADGGEPSPAMRRALDMSAKARKMRDEILAEKPAGQGGAQ